MSNDGRHFLVTKLVCAECGNLLNLSYKPPKKNGGTYADGEPTGASMRATEIAVEPCSHCMEPSKKMADAVKTLLGVAGGMQ